MMRKRKEQKRQLIKDRNGEIVRSREEMSNACREYCDGILNIEDAREAINILHMYINSSIPWL